MVRRKRWASFRVLNDIKYNLKKNDVLHLDNCGIYTGDYYIDDIKYSEDNSDFTMHLTEDDITLVIGKYLDKSPYFYFNCTDEMVNVFNIDYNRGFRSLESARIYAEKCIVKFMEKQLKQLKKDGVVCD